MSLMDIAVADAAQILGGVEAVYQRADGSILSVVVILSQGTKAKADSDGELWLGDVLTVHRQQCGGVPIRNEQFRIGADLYSVRKVLGDDELFVELAVARV